MSFVFSSSQALKLLHLVALDLVCEGDPDLSFRQISVLLEIYLTPAPHSVKDLAIKMKVTKPVITRALDTLGKLDLITRRRDEKDLRNLIISRTITGALFIERISTRIRERAAHLESPLARLAEFDELKENDLELFLRRA